MITCIHCRQDHSDDRHECLKGMSIEEVMELPEEVTIHLLGRQQRARFLQAFFEGGDFEGHDPKILSSPLVFNRASMVDSIALARENMIKEVGHGDHIGLYDEMSSRMLERLFPEEEKG